MMTRCEDRLTALELEEDDDGCAPVDINGALNDPVRDRQTEKAGPGAWHMAQRPGTKAANVHMDAGIDAERGQGGGCK